MLNDTFQPDPNSAKIGNIEFLHINIDTPGKSNALNKGNCITHQRGIEVAMSIDADTLIGSNAIRKMFATSYRELILNGINRSLLTGTFTGEIHPRKAGVFYKKYFGRYAKSEYSDSHVCGAFMSWNPSTLIEIGGFLPLAAQDYAMGVQMRQAGGAIVKVPDADVHGYVASNLKEKLKGTSRSVRGRLQLKTSRPDLANIVMKDTDYLWPVWKRALNRLLLACCDPHPMKVIARALIDEIAIWNGKAEFKSKEALSSSWSRISTSKLD
jgi:cellulose synthase/poly-beta-1,6-N-acetylglucosamine synthase-like glycosyltransferase